MIHWTFYLELALFILSSILMISQKRPVLKAGYGFAARLTFGLALLILAMELILKR